MPAKSMIGYDLIIIGAGPAGMSAALYAARQRLSFAIISKDVGGMANYIPEIETYLGYHYLSGYDLLQRFEEHLEEYRVKINQGEEVREIRHPGEAFIVSTNKADYACRTIIVASGRGFRRLNVPGEEKYQGKGVSFCAACDGPLFRDKVVAVIGGGKSGLLSTLYIQNIVKKVYLIEAGPSLTASPEIVEAVKALKNVEILTGAKTTEISGDRFVTRVKISQNGAEKEIRVEGVFVEIGHTPNTDFIRNVVELNGRGEIVIDKNNMTSVPGIFAAGDVTDVKEKQVLVAAGEGAKALMAVVEWLSEKKAERQAEEASVSE